MTVEVPENPSELDRVKVGSLQEVFDKGRELIDKGEYSAAFSALAQRVDELYEGEFQVGLPGDVRVAVDKLLKRFARDIKDEQKLDKRLKAIDEALNAVPDAEWGKSNSAAHEQQEYLKTLYQTVYPMLYDQIGNQFNGMFHSVIIGAMTGGVQIDGEIIRSFIVKYLDAAPAIATTLAPLDSARRGAYEEGRLRTKRWQEKR